jgi:hypothetical protein
MAETPPGGPSYGQGTSGFPGAPGQFSGAQSGPPSWPASPPRGASRLLTFVSLGISVIATVLAIVGWFRPTPTAAPAAGPGGPTYTEQQTADAKHDVCDAYALVRTAVSASTNKQSAGGDAFAANTAIAANARLGLYGGGGYLLSRLSGAPATPPDLANALRSLGETIQKLAVVDLGEQPESVQAPLRDAVPGAIAKIDEQCK